MLVRLKRSHIIEAKAPGLELALRYPYEMGMLYLYRGDQLIFA